MQAFLDALERGEIEVVDLTHPLDGRTPGVHPPAPFASSPGLELHELSCYDERGPRWKWHRLELGEHLGTHFDAPVHWITGRDGEDLADVPVRRLVGPAIVIDRSQQAAADPDYVLTLSELRAFLDEHGPLPAGGWLLLRTGWGRRAGDPEAFMNVADGRPRTPGWSVDCARWLAEESPIAGVGVETWGTDAGIARGFDPPNPAHHYLLGAGKYGLAQLANLDALPISGALLVVAPLRIVGGTGSPARVIALVPRAS
jgi:kynurenine formamidase